MSTDDVPARSIEAMLYPQLALPAQAEIQRVIRVRIQTGQNRVRTGPGTAQAARFIGGVIIGSQSAGRMSGCALPYIDSDLTLLHRRQRKTLAASCRPMLRRSTTWVISSPQAAHLQAGVTGGSFASWSIGSVDSNGGNVGAIMDYQMRRNREKRIP